MGENKESDAILATLGLSRSDTGRFRDCFVSKGKIVIYTRNGGGNRKYYPGVFDILEEHPCYLNDKDDTFDSTYATLYFKFPDKFLEELKKRDSGIELDPSKRWIDAIEKIGG